METRDLADLFGFIQTLPAVSRENEDHELAFAFQWRRPLGIWKLLFLDEQDILKINDGDETLLRGQYLVEGMAHCGECHTSRNLIGGMEKSSWLSGGPAPEGDGKIPNITPHKTGIGDWSKEDIVYYLESGFTPDYDSARGSMVDVQQNMAKLPKSDLEAIAQYLKTVPAVASK
jgi:mono/diheme cytochrome c family protein